MSAQGLTNDATIRTEDLTVRQIPALVLTSKATELGVPIEVGDIETESLDVSSCAEMIAARGAQSKGANHVAVAVATFHCGDQLLVGPGALHHDCPARVRT